MRDRRGSFWVSLTLQTTALLIAANANEMAAAEPFASGATSKFATEFFIKDPNDDNFLYRGSVADPVGYLNVDEGWADARMQAHFDAPVLLEQSDRLLLGAIDHWNEAPAGDDDWLLAY